MNNSLETGIKIAIAGTLLTGMAKLFDGRPVQAEEPNPKTNTSLSLKPSADDGRVCAQVLTIFREKDGHLKFNPTSCDSEGGVPVDPGGVAYITDVFVNKQVAIK